MNRFFNISPYLFLALCLAVYFLVVLPVKENYYNTINTYRQQKDYFLKNSDDSPLEVDQQKAFKKLKYFPLDKNLIMEAGVRLYNETDTVNLKMYGAVKKEDEPFEKIGKIIISNNSRTFSLDFYKHVDEKSTDRYFLPFHDRSNSNTSFLKGRYLELIIDSSTVSQTIDFNMAYNPFCAYNVNYFCPEPPESNYLPFRVEAGEMRF